MSTTFGRFRKRVTPIRKGGVQPLGYYNSMTTSGGVPTGIWHPAQINPQSFNYQAPYSKAEYCCDSIHSGPPYLEGGPFKSLKLTFCEPYNGAHGKGTYVRSDGLQRYVGGFEPPANSYLGGTDISNFGPFFVPNSSLFPSMGGYGTKAWRSAKPKIERGGLFVFLAEARDLPRMLRTTSKTFHDIWNVMGGNTTGTVMQPKKIADNFLNHQFGWVPFVNDIRKTIDAYQNSQRYLKDLTSRNGKWTRRKVTVLEESSSVKVNSGLGQVIGPVLGTHWSHYFSVQPSWEVYEEIKTSVNAVGSFTYYRPEFDSSLTEYNSAWNALQRNLSLYGLRISPSNIYKATPWTWAVDWFTDAGDYVDYLSDILVDSVVSKYFYLMQSQTITRKFRQVLPFYRGSLTLEFVKEIKTKQRESGSSPFDFSLAWNDLSPRQMAILAALRISRR